MTVQGLCDALKYLVEQDKIATDCAVKFAGTTNGHFTHVKFRTQEIRTFDKGKVVVEVIKYLSLE